MRIIESGHVYEFDNIDGETETPNRIVFVNREEGTQHAGTQTQDVIRALIDRTLHCDKCLRWDGNDLIVHHLRMALSLHEARAILRKTEKGQIQPEHIALADDGHFALRYGNH